MFEKEMQGTETETETEPRNENAFETSFFDSVKVLYIIHTLQVFSKQYSNIID